MTWPSGPSGMRMGWVMRSSSGVTKLKRAVREEREEADPPAPPKDDKCAAPPKDDNCGASPKDDERDWGLA